jgi:hypothetical protein
MLRGASLDRPLGERKYPEHDDVDDWDEHEQGKRPMKASLTDDAPGGNDVQDNADSQEDKEKKKVPDAVVTP